MGASYALNRLTGAARTSLLTALVGAVVLAGALKHFLTGDDAGNAAPELSASAETAVRAAQTGDPGDRPSLGLGGTLSVQNLGEPESTAEGSRRPASAGRRSIEEPPSLPPEVLEDETAIAGRVLREDGTPIDSVRVALQRLRSFDPRTVSGARGEVLSATSDALGFYYFLALEPGLYRLRAEPPADYEETARIVRTGRHSENLVLKQTGGIWAYGLVTDGGGKPLEGVLVSQSNRPEQETLTDAEGRFSLALAVGGQRRNLGLRFRLDGYREERLLIGSPAGLEETPTIEVDVALRPH